MQFANSLHSFELEARVGWLQLKCVAQNNTATDTLEPRGGRFRGSWDANYPCPPPPPLGAFGQQLVAKGVALRPPWAPKAPDAP